MPKRPLVGVGVIVIKKGKVLLGKRKGAHGNGTWNFPGGHLEWNESWKECVRREVYEEAGIRVKDVRFATAINDIFEKERTHYITIFMICNFKSGEVRVMEPGKCEKWDWFSWNKLPKPLFTPIRNLLKRKFSLS